MPILLDIGNTSATYGHYHGGRLLKFGYALYSDVPHIVRNRTSGGAEDTLDIVISSVVPQITRFLLKSLRSIRGTRILVVGKDIPVKIRHKYKRFNRLGVDRKVNLYGALRIYSPPLLVIDFGTAVTFDLLSQRGVFEGGMIVPGPEIAFQTLLKRAALIPKKLRLPLKARAFLGRDTYSCLSSGILHGYACLADGLIERFKRRFGAKLQVIATGGFAKHLMPYSHDLGIYDPKHSIKSLLILYKDYRKKIS